MKKRYNNNNKIKITVYVIIRALVVAVMISEIIDRDLNNIMICALTLILLMLPDMLEHRLRIKLPTALEVMIVLFIFAAEILGEIHGFYVMFPEWDDMLHTINGFLAAAVGVAMIDILNRSEKVKFQLTPLSVALAAFSFSMTIGVLWEFLNVLWIHISARICRRIHGLAPSIRWPLIRQERTLRCMWMWNQCL